MTGAAMVMVDAYLSWRSWLRIRYRTWCTACGVTETGFPTEDEAFRAAARHAAWHGLLAAILRRAVRDGIVPDERG